MQPERILELGGTSLVFFFLAKYLPNVWDYPYKSFPKLLYLRIIYNRKKRKK